jgi:uncharacterized membrane protein
MAVFWALVIVGGFLLVNSSSRHHESGSHSPDGTLKRRLATGEIDEEQYRILRDEIHGRPHGPTAAVH